jgi:hypothetical protein
MSEPTPGGRRSDQVASPLVVHDLKPKSPHPGKMVYQPENNVISIFKIQFEDLN